MTSEARLDMKPDAKEMGETVSVPAPYVTLSKRDFLTVNVAIKDGFTPNPALQKARTTAAKVKRA